MTIGVYAYDQRADLAAIWASQYTDLVGRKSAAIVRPWRNAIIANRRTQALTCACIAISTKVTPGAIRPAG